MPQFIMLAWAWLGPLQYLTVTLALVLSIDLWKKVHPKSWNWVMLRTPYALELSKAQELAHNLLIALPQVLGSALVAALVTGGDLKSAAFAALAGAGAPLTHHAKKWVESVKKQPPRGGDEKPVGLTDPEPTRIRFAPPDPTPPDAAIRKWRHPEWRFAPAVLLMLLVTGCGLLTAQNAKTAQQIAHDLCVMHYGKAKPALSLDDIARTYCKEIDPWLEAVGGAEKLGATKAAAKARKQ